MEQDTDQIRAKTTSKNGDISCSVEETNRIRAALGLKPLRVTKPELPPPKPSEPKQQSSDKLHERIQASRAARRHRNAAIAPRSIAEQALLEEDDDDDEDALQAWVERSRIRSVPRPPQVDEQPIGTRRASLTSREESGTVAEDIDLSTGETKTLTLRDVGVVETRDDILEDNNAAEAFRRKNREEEINGMVYDGTDNSQFEKPAEREGVQSLADLPRVVESDYKSEAIFRKVKKRSKKRRRTDPVIAVPGTTDALRKAADARVTQESDDDDDDHYELLRKATAKAAERNIEGSVSRMLKAVEKAEHGGDKEMEDGAKLIEEEMAQYIGGNDMDYSDSEEEDGEREEEATGIVRDEVRDDVKMEDKNTANAEAVAKLPIVPKPPLAETVPETGLETNGMTGIAATLARLRSKGELKQNVSLRGRGKDKRLKGGSVYTGKKEIKLIHVDEYGNPLTPKEAFKLLCHSFHGKGPGQNKREKRLRKMLEAAKKRSMQSDDTPLASTAALKAETRRLGSAHIVLSGSQALQVPVSASGSASTGREGKLLKE